MVLSSVRKCIKENCEELTTAKFCWNHYLEDRRKKEEVRRAKECIERLGISEVRRQQWLQSDEYKLMVEQRTTKQMEKQRESEERERIRFKKEAMERAERLKKKEEKNEKRKVQEEKAFEYAKRVKENQIKRVEKLYGKPIEELILPGESISDFLREEGSIKEVKNLTLGHRTYRSACKSCRDFQGYSSCGKDVIIFCSLSKKTHCKELINE